MLPQNFQPSDKNSKTLQWEVFVEKAGMWGVPDLIKFGFKDQINTTKDTTDYLWYTARLVILLAKTKQTCNLPLPLNV